MKIPNTLNVRVWRLCPTGVNIGKMCRKISPAPWRMVKTYPLKISDHPPSSASPEHKFCRFHDCEWMIRALLRYIRLWNITVNGLLELSQLYFREVTEFTSGGGGWGSSLVEAKISEVPPPTGFANIFGGPPCRRHNILGAPHSIYIHLEK